MSVVPKREGTDVLCTHIDAVSWNESLTHITGWAQANESRYVCLCNVHSVVTARRSPEFCRILNEADLATPDGMPLAWCLQYSGFPEQPRINGPDLFWELCRYCARHGVPIFLYGGTDHSLALLRSRLAAALPELPLAGSHSPPFRDLTNPEEREVAARINASGARIVFVGLGCPKQEVWMARQRGRIKAVMIGVGAAFDFHAGVVKRAPRWMQNSGLEWLYRFAAEPRRLWQRYLVTNSLFACYLALQLARGTVRRTYRTRVFGTTRAPMR